MSGSRPDDSFSSVLYCLPPHAAPEGLPHPAWARFAMLQTTDDICRARCTFRINAFDLMINHQRRSWLSTHRLPRVAPQASAQWPDSNRRHSSSHRQTACSWPPLPPKLARTDHSSCPRGRALQTMAAHLCPRHDRRAIRLGQPRVRRSLVRASALPRLAPNGAGWLRLHRVSTLLPYRRRAHAP